MENRIPAFKAITTYVINPAAVDRVYTGRDGKCCCGCSGKYSEPGDMAKIEETVAIINQHLSTADIDSSYVAVVIGKKVHIAYFG